MQKLSKTLAGCSVALALAAMSAGSSFAQETPPLADPVASVQVDLEAVEGAEGSGEATLSAATGGQTEATVEVDGLPPGTEWSAFLVSGSCDEPGQAISPLGTIEVSDQGSGKGSTAVTAELAALTASPATVQIHPQGETPTQAVLCGGLAATAAPPAPAPAF